MKTIVIGDIHGCYNELKELIRILKKSGEYNKDTDKLIFLGDYVDRGDNSRLVIEFIRNLQKENKNVIALMGNHEDMLLDYFKDTNSRSWIYNGYEKTLKSYDGYENQFKDDILWMKNLPLYHEDEHFIYVHAGVDVNKSLEEQDAHTLLWIREEFIFNEIDYYKQIIFGHTPTANFIKDWKPVYTPTNHIDIDTGCVYGGALSALIIEDDEVKGFIQVDSKNQVGNKKELNV